MSIVHTLKELSLNNTILIVDDSPKLRAHLTEFLERFFLNVYSAKSGDEGVEIFKKKKPDIIITDIQMEEVNGLEMAKSIKSIDYDVPIIVMSAYDEKEYLLESIKFGVINYLKKPVKINVLCEVLVEVLRKIKVQKNKKLFDKYAHDLFKEENSLILLFEHKVPILANPAFLDFFHVNNVKEFLDECVDIGSCFLKQDEFLYNSQEHWFNVVSKHSGAHYHTKISDKDHKHHHFLLKYINLSDKDGYGLLTLDDITELNLLALFNIDDTDGDGKFYEDDKTIEKSINHLMEKEIHINVYNFYKGLSITNKAKIISFENKTIVLKVNVNQLIASRYEKSLIIGSDVLPSFIWCDEIVSFNDEQQHITATKLKFMRNNPAQRKNVRLQPDSDYKISLFFKLKKFLGDISIVELSINTMKLKMNSLLVGMRDGESVEISVNLARKNNHISFDIHSKILRIDRYDTYYYIIIEFELDSDTRKQLVEYISKRQLELIKEFKAMKP